MNAFVRIIDALNRHQVRYVVVGGFAALLHGNNRATADLDLVIDLTPAEARKAMSALESIGLVPRLPVKPMEFCDQSTRDRWRAERNLMVFTMYDPKTPMPVVDLFVSEPIPFSDLMQSSISVTVQKVDVRVCSIDHLIRMKSDSGRPQDLLDISNLNSIKSNRAADRNS